MKHLRQWTNIKNPLPATVLCDDIFVLSEKFILCKMPASGTGTDNKNVLAVIPDLCKYEAGLG